MCENLYLNKLSTSFRTCPLFDQFRTTGDTTVFTYLPSDKIVRKSRKQDNQRKPKKISTSPSIGHFLGWNISDDKNYGLVRRRINEESVDKNSQFRVFFHFHFHLSLHLLASQLLIIFAKELFAPTRKSSLSSVTRPFLLHPVCKYDKWQKQDIRPRYTIITHKS